MTREAAETFCFVWERVLSVQINEIEIVKSWNMLCINWTCMCVYITGLRKVFIQQILISTTCYKTEDYESQSSCALHNFLTEEKKRKKISVLKPVLKSNEGFKISTLSQSTAWYVTSCFGTKLYLRWVIFSTSHFVGKPSKNWSSTHLHNWLRWSW